MRDVIALEAPIAGALSTVGAPLGPGTHHGPGRAAGADGGGCGLSGVHVGLLLRLNDVLLVADPLVAEPIAHLKNILFLAHIRNTSKFS